MSASNPLLVARGRHNALARSRQPGDPALVEAARVLAAENLAAYVTKIVDTAPPLSDEQRARITALLRPSAAT